MVFGGERREPGRQLVARAAGHPEEIRRRLKEPGYL
jgi:hypothetical protein